MVFGGAAEKFKNSRTRCFIEKAFNSYWFPLVTAALTVLCSLVGWEPLIIWYICLCGAAICLCCKDVTPAVCLLMFMHIIVSMKHSPDKRGVEWCDPGYMTGTGFIVQASIAVAIFVIPVLYRLIDGIIKRRFKLTPIFFGLCAYGAALLLNGVFSENYYYMNFFYALGMTAIILVVYAFVYGNVTCARDSYKKIAVYFIALCVALAVQLLAAYLTFDVVRNGKIERGAIKFGWGSYNQFGMLITMCVPAWFYLAEKCKHGWAFLLGEVFNLAVVLLCMSRQAILMSALLAVVCYIRYMVVSDKRKRIAGGILAGASAVVALIVIVVKHDEIAVLFSGLETMLSTGSNRTDIWKDGLQKFLHYPLFGNGFYDTTATYWMTPGYCGAGYGFTQAIPFMCHNTLVQLLFSCGLAGLIAYLVHRVQTVISLFKNPSGDRIFLALTICGLLLTSLLDNHIFYPLPLFIYAPLLAVFAATEKKDERPGNPQPETACADAEQDGEGGDSFESAGDDLSEDADTVTAVTEADGG